MTLATPPLQTEPDIAVNPHDPDHLVLGLIDYNFPNNSAYVSIDGGVNWEGPQQIKYLRKDRISGGDPVVEFDRDGNVYMASISIGIKEYSVGNATGFALVSSIAVSTSKDGGFVWEEPVDSARSDVESDVVLDPTGRIRRFSKSQLPRQTVAHYRPSSHDRRPDGGLRHICRI